MEKKNKKSLLEKYANLSIKKWKLVLLFGFLLTIISIIGIFTLKLELTYFSLMSNESPKVKDLKKITNDFPSSSNIFVVIESKNKEKLISSINKISSELSKSKYKKYISNVYSTVDTEFIKKNLLLFENSQLENKTITIEYLNKQIEKNLFSKKNLSALDKENINLSLESFNNFLAYLIENKFINIDNKSNINEKKLLSTLKNNDPNFSIYKNISRIIDTAILPQKYFINKDQDMAIIMVQPNFTINDFQIFTNGVLTIDKGVKKIAKELGVKVGLTGLTVVAKDEMVTSEKGLEASTMIALLLILFLLITNFRTLSLPLLSSIPLVIGIIWTVGFTGLIIGKLNIMTAMYMIALLGLGIDYAIHLLTAFVFERETHNFAQSIILSFKKSGRGIITGALTTSAAFFTLYIAKSGIVKELGIVAGIGIISELLSMFIFIPVLLKIRDNKLNKKGKPDPITTKKSKFEIKFTKNIGESIKKRYYVFILLSLIVVIFTGLFANKVKIQSNLMEMEAKGLESIELQSKLEKKFDMTPDGMFIISKSIDETQKLSSQLSKLDSVSFVDSIAFYIPPKNIQKKNINNAKQLKQQINEFNTLIKSMNNISSLLYFYNQYISQTYSKNLQPHKNQQSGKNMQSSNKDIYLNSFYIDFINLKTNIEKLAEISGFKNIKKLKDNLNKIYYKNYIYKTKTSNNNNSTNNNNFINNNNSIYNNISDLTNLNKSNILLLSLILDKSLLNYLYMLTDIKKITINDIPENIKNTYFSKDNKYNLITILPKKNLWVEENRKQFKNEIETVTDKATGMVLVADVMTEIAKKDGILASIAAIIVIFIIILIDFKNIQLAFFTIIPLIFALISLSGFMGLFKIKFDFVNIIAIPLLIGMGVDDAIHFAHRYKIEGKGNMNIVVDKIGKAVTLTTLTTIFGFASFIPSPMRAMKSTGIVLSLAMALAWFYSVFFFPAFLIFINEKLHININPYFTKNK